MTQQHAGAVAMAIVTLVEAYHVSPAGMPPTRTKVYEKALLKVPMGLLPAMTQRAIETRPSRGKDWLPSVADLLVDAEACRRVLVAANPYTGCAECEDQRGWRKLHINGFELVQRCPCWDRHQQKLAQLGVTGGPLVLPAASSSELTRVGEVE